MLMMIIMFISNNAIYFVAINIMKEYMPFFSLHTFSLFSKVLQPEWLFLSIFVLGCNYFVCCFSMLTFFSNLELNVWKQRCKRLCGKMTCFNVAIQYLQLHLFHRQCVGARAWRVCKPSYTGILTAPLLFVCLVL